MIGCRGPASEPTGTAWGMRARPLPTRTTPSTAAVTRNSGPPFSLGGRLPVRFRSWRAHERRAAPLCWLFPSLTEMARPRLPSSAQPSGRDAGAASRGRFSTRGEGAPFRHSEITALLAGAASPGARNPALRVLPTCRGPGRPAAEPSGSPQPAPRGVAFQLRGAPPRASRFPQSLTLVSLP